MKSFKLKARADKPQLRAAQLRNIGYAHTWSGNEYVFVYVDAESLWDAVEQVEYDALKRLGANLTFMHNEANAISK